MHTPLLVGVLSAATVVALALAVFFGATWRRRTQDREYAYFALLCVALSAYLGILDALNLLALGVDLPVSRAACLKAITVPVSFAVAFQLHFALRYGGVASRRLMPSVYVLAGAFAVLGLSDGWWSGAAPEAVVVSQLGLELHVLELEHSASSMPFFVEAIVVAVVLVAMVARRWWRQREAGAGALVGAVVALFATINDISLAGFGFEPLMPLMPFGMLVLGYGVAMTLVARYGRVSTDLERSTAALEERSSELGASYRELKRAQQELVRSKQLAVVGELSAVIAHEVRNPLAIVNNAVASLRKRNTRGEERRVLLGIINEEMGRLDQLVTRMLDYARPLVPERRSVDLRELVNKGQRLADGIEVRVIGDGVVMGDPELLRRALDNLLQNAVQARARRVEVRVVEEDGFTQIRFADDGEGMSEAAAARALSPFFTTRPTGTGLGLPVVARIAEAHGGYLELLSRLGAGTTITLRLAGASRPAARSNPAPVSVRP